MPSPDVTIIEDEPDIGELIRFHLEREGLSSRVIRSGQTGLAEVRRHPPRLVVLDLMLPDLDGLEICRRLKWDESTRAVPILIVSAKGEEADIVTGLELGAEDYMTKPFSPSVLIARVRNILRRGEKTRAEEAGQRRRLALGNGDLVIDLDRHSVLVQGQDVPFTRTEFEILHYLATRPGFVRTRDQIITAAHGDSAVLTSRTVDVHVTSIRRKLGDLGGMLTTVRGVGYRIEDLEDNNNGA